MNNFKGIAAAFVFWFIILSPGMLICSGTNIGQNTVGNKLEKSKLKDMVQEAYSLLTTSSLGSWDKVKSFINQMQIKFSPLNLDFRSADDSSAKGVHKDAQGRMKEAAEKSFGTSKQAVEESAKSAAKVVGEIAEKTKEKISGSKSAGEHSRTEL